ncbi:hypothetical protein ONZ43_g6628 [Nemania bipapillata]|uniref:Uncharacterized protein n=1 Tax=Nemania bipapillata TaxID=110536 RepID=A0ACC2HXI3_9PEZI|nr:hypothetical protein ONZ43_g6628 [Nemania bipapillata]
MDGPSQSTKRRLDASLETPSLPAAKRARLSKTDLQQPAPKHPRASFLEDHVELTDTISEWLESVGSDRERRCRSDSYLHASSDDLISRSRTKSAPQMAYNRDTDGYAVPLTPGPSYGSVAPSDAGSGRSSRALVEDPLYRNLNLAANGIYMRPRYEPFPEHIANVVDYARKKRDSPGPSPDDMYRDMALDELETRGLDEPEVEEYFRDRVFPKPNPRDDLRRSDRQPMSRHAVPNAGPQFKVSNPIPDMLYGYSRHHAFPGQQTQLISMGTEPVANNQDLMYPFFVIKFKGNGGDLWVATNQCLGGSASCVNIAERLNRQLKACKSSKVKPVDSTAFSIAMNGTEARLYVSWKHSDLDYYMQKVDSFLLQKPQDYIEFRKHVRNIIDWGKDTRLKEIRESLDTLLEESRKHTSEAAKSRPPPTKDSTSKSKRHKPPPSRKSSSSGHDTKQARSEPEDPYWQWSETAGQYYHVNPDRTIEWAPSAQQSPHPIGHINTVVGTSTIKEGNPVTPYQAVTALQARNHG